jgi:hypothetical protein
MTRFNEAIAVAEYRGSYSDTRKAFLLPFKTTRNLVGWRTSIRPNEDD